MDQRREFPAPSTMRASDRDRQDVVDRLTSAMTEGRLSMHEFETRMATAYKSTTYGELGELFADLPIASPLGLPDPPAHQPARQSSVPPQRTGAVRGLPTWIKILWTVWF